MHEFFADQLRQIQELMADPKETVRCLHVDEDIKPVAVKMLSGYSQDRKSPHVLIPSTAGFKNRNQFFRALLDDVLESYEASERSLKKAGVFEPFTRKDLST